MRVLVSGASGLVGRELSAALLADGHTVCRLVRPGSPEAAGDVRWDPESGTVDVRAMEGCDAIVNLNGASIGQRRWTDSRKAVLRRSRVNSTRVLIDSLSRLKQKPRLLVSASAVGYYGNRGDEILTESSDPGTDFLAKLACDWESEALRAEREGIRTVILRFGVILSAKGGALPQMMRPFKLGIGGRVGNGRQWMSWIALDDVIEIIRAAISNERCSGAMNAMAPNPAQNAEFTRALATVLRRPAIFAVPAFALRLAFGEMADALLLTSQRARPVKLLTAGYDFRLLQLEPALRAILGCNK
ncbi:MAG: TIGR01777 family oxidoreductase [Candidatus Acidiferrales bacterium]